MAEWGYIKIQTLVLKLNFLLKQIKSQLLTSIDKQFFDYRHPTKTLKTQDSN